MYCKPIKAACIKPDNDEKESLLLGPFSSECELGASERRFCFPVSHNNQLFCLACKKIKRLFGFLGRESSSDISRDVNVVVGIGGNNDFLTKKLTQFDTKTSVGFQSFKGHETLFAQGKKSCVIAAHVCAK